jgi:hypothetical protein
MLWLEVQAGVAVVYMLRSLTLSAGTVAVDATARHSTRDMTCSRNRLQGNTLEHAAAATK